MGFNEKFYTFNFCFVSSGLLPGWIAGGETGGVGFDVINAATGHQKFPRRLGKSAKARLEVTPEDHATRHFQLEGPATCRKLSIEPPTKQGDYAYLLHIIRSMNSTGKAACILAHGVLFRGNAEAVIRKDAGPIWLSEGNHRRTCRRCT